MISFLAGVLVGVLAACAVFFVVGVSCDLFKGEK